MTRLALEGEITIYQAAELRPRLVEALAAAGALEIDLAAVTALDTAGVQLLLAARREARARTCELTFANPSPAVVEVLDLLGLRGGL
jgi:anti-anti-sigma factor